MNRITYVISAVASACVLTLFGCAAATDSGAGQDAADAVPVVARFDPTVARTPKPSKSLTLAPDWQPPAPTRGEPVRQKARVQPTKHWGVPARVLGRHPSDAELRAIPYFSEPLRPVPGTSAPAETEALGAALREEWRNNRRIVALERFLEVYPVSRWAPAIHLNLGRISLETGYFKDALAHWKAGWELAKSGEDVVSQDLANLALAESAKMNARIGRIAEVEVLLAEAQKRTLMGDARVKIGHAAEGAWMMRHEPGVSFRCGPYALINVAKEQNLENGKKTQAFLDKTQSPITGFSIPEVHRMASELGLKLQIARRDVGAPVIAPSVVHWRVGHFAAVVREEKGRFLLKDPTFGEDRWVTAKAMDREASGYFLVPAGPLPSGWSSATASETAHLYGKGNAQQVDDKNRHMVGGNCQADRGEKPTAMAVYRLFTLGASVHIEDTPIAYSPAFGPDVRVQVTYNQREPGQSTVMDYTSFSPQFSTNWGDYIQPAWVEWVDACPETNIECQVPINHPGHDRSDPLRGEIRSPATVPGGWKVSFPDGRQHYYEHVIGDPLSVAPPLAFQSRIVDPQGNEVTIEYDTTHPTRVQRLVDATGLPTEFHYDYPNEPYLVTSIEDPYGRTATFAYAQTAAKVRLQSTEDPNGIVSSFTYNAAGEVVTMATPYGTTTFTFSDPYVNNGGTLVRYVEATDPLGQTERLEYTSNSANVPGTLEAPQPSPSVINFSASYNNYRNSFYWDKLLTKDARGDYQKARLYHWLHKGANTVTDIIESERAPLEGRVFYNYPGQSSPPIYTGGLALPTAVGRVVKDAAGNNQTQATKLTYNAQANVTKVTDPLGRETVIEYAANGIDVLTVKQKTGASTYTTMGSSTYGGGAPPHRPGSVTDGAGKTTTFTYASTGQVLTITNAKSEVTTFTYDTNTSSATYGRLLSITDDVPGGNRTFTYDGAGRVQTTTDSDGYVLSYGYDNLDRLRAVTHPDGSTEQVEYEDHSLVATKDREGRWTRHMYNGVMQRVVTQDPQQRTTQFQWCRCGDLKRFVDGNGSITEWQRDVGSRVTRKIHPNGQYDTYTYDQSGRLSTEVDALSRTVTYTYGVDDRLAKKDYSDSTTPDVTYAYDAYFPRVTSRMDGSGTTTFTYLAFGGSTNGAGQVSLVNGPLADDTQKYTYDELGRLKKLEILNDALGNANYAEEYTFDGRGRVTTVANNLGSTAYGFVGQSNRPSSVTYPNGMKAEYEYFAANGDFLLKQIKNLTSGETPGVISKFDYTYRGDRSIATWQVEQGGGAKTWTFGYDDARQLTSAVLRDGVQVTPLESLTYGYDRAGNRIQVGNGTTAPKNYETNKLNQLLSERDFGRTTFAGFVDEAATVRVNGTPAKVMSTDGGAPFKFEAFVDLDAGANTVVVEAKDGNNNTATKTYSVTTTGTAKKYEYDAHGNLRFEKLPNNSVVREYRWDQQNRLVKELHGTHESAYEYDGASRRWRITEKENGTQTKQETFVWCGSRICQKRSGSTVVRSYFGGGFQESGTTNYFYARDHLGSVREVVGSDGTTIASRLSYDPWGKVTETGSGAVSDFTYTGHYADRATGLSLAQYRAYDPAVGRWIARDPMGIAGGLNLYGYVGNDPVNFMDPLGLESAPTREELTFIAELLGVGNTAHMINERSASIDAVARGDMAGAECHAQNALGASIAAVGEIGLGVAGSNVVYRSLTASGKVQYVGITNNLARRSAEHLAKKGIHVEKLMGNLSRADARAVEQALIEHHGLGKEGGSLLNEINSIAASNPTYAAQLQRGYELLRSIGY